LEHAPPAENALHFVPHFCAPPIAGRVPGRSRSHPASLPRQFDRGCGAPFEAPRFELAEAALADTPAARSALTVLADRASSALAALAKDAVGSREIATLERVIFAQAGDAKAERSGTTLALRADLSQGGAGIPSAGELRNAISAAL
jgi:hypothetical protein